MFYNGWLDVPAKLLRKLRTSERNKKETMTMATMFNDSFPWARHCAKSFTWNAHSVLAATL